MTNNPKTIRVATTVTNVKEGTLGAEVPNAFAASDALYTARDQMAKLRDLRLISGAEYDRAIQGIEQAGDIARRVFLDKSDENLAAAKEAMARYEARQAIRAAGR